jgi:hypothetical protein
MKAILTELRTMWPGDMEPEAQAIWASHLAEFDDLDPDVAAAMTACRNTCRFRPTWAEFSDAYLDARRARTDPSRLLAIAAPKDPEAATTGRAMIDSIRNKIKKAP